MYQQLKAFFLPIPYRVYSNSFLYIMYICWHVDTRPYPKLLYLHARSYIYTNLLVHTYIPVAFTHSSSYSLMCMISHTFTNICQKTYYTCGYIISIDHVCSLTYTHLFNPIWGESDHIKYMDQHAYIHTYPLTYLTLSHSCIHTFTYVLAYFQNRTLMFSQA